jgi:hypothetical protein
MVNCLASSTGEMSSRRIDRPLGTRGIRGAGGDRSPPETARLGPSPPVVRCLSVSLSSYFHSMLVLRIRWTYPPGNEVRQLSSHSRSPFGM